MPEQAVASEARGGIFTYIVLAPLLFLVGLGSGGAVTYFYLNAHGHSLVAEPVVTRERNADDASDIEDRALKDAEVQRLVTELRGWREKRDREVERLALEREQLARQRAAIREAEESIEKLRASLMAKVVETKSDQQKNFKKLASIYGKMEPAMAAQLASMLPEEDAAQLVYSMDERQAGMLLSAYAQLGERGREAAAKLTDTMKRLSAPVKAEEGTAQ